MLPASKPIISKRYFCVQGMTASGAVCVRSPVGPTYWNCRNEPSLVRQSLLRAPRPPIRVKCRSPRLSRFFRSKLRE
ncbi:hypothetical protein D3C73_1550650 [compost metagenome]